VTNAGLDHHWRSSPFFATSAADDVDATSCGRVPSRATLRNADTGDGRGARRAPKAGAGQSGVARWHAWKIPPAVSGFSRQMEPSTASLRRLTLFGRSDDVVVIDGLWCLPVEQERWENAGPCWVHVGAIGLTLHDACAAMRFGGRLCAEFAGHGQISVQPAGQMVARTRSAQPSGISP
jgi:hypothetical protein